MKIIGFILAMMGAIGLLALFAYGLFKLHVLLGVGFIFFSILAIGCMLAEDDLDDIYKNRW